MVYRNDRLRIAITGANGFIGHKLVERMLLEGASVIAICGPDADLPTSPSESWFSGRMPNKLQIVKHYNSHENNEIKKLMGQVDVFCHLAALSLVEEGDKNPEITFSINSEWTRNLYKSAAFAGVKRFIFTSSATIYGDNPLGIVSEESPCHPIGAYANSKYQAEKDLLLLSEAVQTNLTILRLSHIYGPNQQFDHIIPSFIFNALNNGYIEIPAEGEENPVDDFVYIDDAIEVFKRVIEYRGNNLPQILNVSTGKATSLRELGNNVLNELKIENNIIFKQGEKIWRRVLDCHLSNTVLGWNPTVDVESGLNKTSTWYLDNLAAIN